MDQSEKDAGTLLVLLERFNKRRLPRAQEMKERLAKGEVLGKHDYILLKSIQEDMGKMRPLISRHPEYEELYSKVVALWQEIAEMDKGNRGES